MTGRRRHARQRRLIGRSGKYPETRLTLRQLKTQPISSANEPSAAIPSEAFETAQETAFKRTVVGCSGFGVSFVLVTLACLQREPGGGLIFVWRWSVLWWVVAGVVSAAWYWQTVWNAHSNSGQGARKRMKWGYVLAAVATAIAFFYPSRFVADENRKDMMFGVTIAGVVIATGCWLMYRIFRGWGLIDEDEKRRG